MLKLYGIPRSRANRCMWMLEEINQPYELIEKSAHPNDLRTPEVLRLNPNARIPILVDGEVVVWESLAINLYLAQKFEGPLHAGSPEIVGKATQWSIWVMVEFESLAQELMQHRLWLAEFARDASHAERAEILLQNPLKVLNESLKGRKFLLGNDFSVGDLNVSAIVSWVRRAGMDLSSVPEVDRWLQVCLARPAYERVLEKVQAG